jgi:tetratricopeptide (TPR) repeat protein
MAPMEPEPSAQSPEEREGAYELLQRGHELLRGRHHAQAAIVLERAARLEPGKASILEALGRAYYNSGQHRRAAATFEELLEVDPTAHYAHYALGQSLKQLGQRREARTHLRLAVAMSPGSQLYQGALDRLGPPPPVDPRPSVEAPPAVDPRPSVEAPPAVDPLPSVEAPPNVDPD